MPDAIAMHAALQVRAETLKLKRGLTLAPLVGIIYLTVCGGTCTPHADAARRHEGVA